MRDYEGIVIDFLGASVGGLRITQTKLGGCEVLVRVNRVV